MQNEYWSSRRMVDVIIKSVNTEVWEKSESASHSVMSNSLQPQVPLSMEFSRPEGVNSSVSGMKSRWQYIKHINEEVESIGLLFL